MRRLLVAALFLLAAEAHAGIPMFPMFGPQQYAAFHVPILADMGSSIGGGTFDTTASISFTGNNTFTGTNLFDDVVTFGASAGGANAITFNSTAGCIVFEGSAANAFEVTLCTVNPAADTGFAFPLVAAGGDFNLVAYEANSASGIPFWDSNLELLTSDADITWVAASDTLQIEVVDAANAISIGNNASSIIFEGSSADAFEATIDVANPTADTTHRIPALGAGTYTFAFLSAAQTWTAINHFNSGGGAITVDTDSSINFGTTISNAFAAIYWGTGTTPDGAALLTGTTDNSWKVFERQDAATDVNNGACGTAACTDPSIHIFGNVANTTDYLTFAYYGTAGKAVKTLTESAATSTVRIPVAAGAGAGGVYTYTVFATDGTDHQSRSSFIRFSVVNKAGTETCGLTNNAGTADASITETEDGNAVAISSGTLTYAITCDVTPANAVDIQINAVSSLTQTTLAAYSHVTLVGPGMPDPQ